MNSKEPKREIICQIEEGNNGDTFIFLAETYSATQMKFAPALFIMKSIKYDITIRENCTQFIDSATNPGIAHFLELCERQKPTDNILLLSDFYQKGSLLDFVRLQRPKAKEFTFLNIETTLTIAYGIAKGLEFLHSKNIPHGNLTLSNILLDRGNRPKLTDFLYNKIPNRDIQIINYTDPDIFGKPTEISKESDMYTYGMIIYEVLTGHVPYEEFNDGILLRDKIKNGLKPPLDSVYAPFLPIIKGCWGKKLDSATVSKQIFEIASNIRASSTFFQYAKSFERTGNANPFATVKISDTCFTRELKQCDFKESSVMMFVTGFIYTKGIGIQNLKHDMIRGLQYVLTSADSLIVAMKFCVQAIKSGKMACSDFNIFKAEEIIRSAQQRKSNQLAIVY